MRRAGSPKRVDKAVFASLGGTSDVMPPLPSQKRASKRSSQKGKDTQQTKLAMFGYFPTKAGKAREFDTTFSDEDDLDFGDEFDGWTPRAAAPDRRPVPAAPPHPLLREAGRRELDRRDAEAMKRHRSQQRPSATPCTDSSSLTPDDGPQTSESTRHWLAKLDASQSSSL